MADMKLQSNPSGTGVFTVQPPNSNTSRTVTLPDATTTLVGTDATQTLTNKTIQGGSLTHDTVKTATGTSVDFTGIPSWVKRITITFDVVSTSGTSQMIVQIGDAGGIENTGYTGTGSSISASAVASANQTAGFMLGTSTTAATAVRSGGATLTRHNNSNTWAFFGITGQSDLAQTLLGSGTKTLSDTLDRVRITTINGTDTFDAGTINIMYEG